MLPSKAEVAERIAGGERVKRHDYDNGLLNICSWLESDDYITESKSSKDINFVHNVNDSKKNIEFANIDNPYPKIYKQKEEYQEGDESTGENPCITNRDYVVNNNKETEPITIYKESDEFEIEDDEDKYYFIEEEIIEEEDEEPTGDVQLKQTGVDNREEIKEKKEHRRQKKIKVHDNNYEMLSENGDVQLKRTGEKREEREKCRRKKRKEYEVFVGGLHRRATKEDICEVFSRTGDVQSVRMAIDPYTKANKGYAFVRYAEIEQARLASIKLKNPVIRGKQCEVTASHENDTLFFGNICKTWTEEHLRKRLEGYGINNYKEMVLVEDARNKGMNKGYAFIEFWNLPEAKRVYETFRRSRMVLGTSRSVKISFAILEQNPESMTKVTTVFIDGISPKWDEYFIKSCLEKFGIIENIKLAKNMKTAKRLDFGYVTFDSHENALKCIEGVNDKGIGKKSHEKVKMRAALCRPLNKHRFSISSRARSSFHRDISNSPARISKRVSESQVSPLRRHNGLMDLDPLKSSSNRSRYYSPERAACKRIRISPDSENYHERIISREHKRSEYSSNHINERRYYRDEECYSCENICREKCCQIMPSYEGEGHFRKFLKSGGSMCQYVDGGNNMYDEFYYLPKSRRDYDVRSADHCSQRCTSMSFRQEMYNNHDDLEYRQGKMSRAYRSSHNSKSLSHRPYVANNNFCCDMFQGCRCGVKRDCY